MWVGAVDICHCAVVAVQEVRRSSSRTCILHKTHSILRGGCNYRSTVPRSVGISRGSGGSRKISFRPAHAESDRGVQMICHAEKENAAVYDMYLEEENGDLELTKQIMGGCVDPAHAGIPRSDHVWCSKI